jgi:serine/threonine protein kinase
MPPESDTGESSDSQHEVNAATQSEGSLVLGSDDESLQLFPQQTGIEFQPGDLIGRYEFESVLGKGGFGQVVKAADHRLNRSVAIKFPRLDKFEKHALAFLEEARSVARLDHTSIVRVYNVEQTDDGWPFVVMEYVEGPTLAKVIREGGLTFVEVLRYFVQLGEALAYAHGETLIHRDIKPANVIISKKDDVAKLADFGMALHDLTPEENLADCPQGTPPYMSPEQLRGENHRLDRRTDIWGFGVLMYTVLTGKKPFSGDELSELVKNICRSEPVAPTEYNRTIPIELERICLRCIEKLMRDRYQQTSDLVDDLKAFEKQLEQWDDDTISSTRILPADTASHQIPGGKTSRSPRAETRAHGHSETLSGFRVVPKGLRSFDTQDTEFFLELLPGPKDRTGIPDSVRFWINQLDADATSPLTVGMIYGPSGCGKSSFVKAGLIPNLDDSIRTIYLEASPEQTESDLLAKIKEVAPNVVRDETKLPVVLSRIRRGQMMTGEKLLIVLDQFEQWLSVQSELERQPLVEALRQCDGQNVCCLLLIRDDFWMSASQFMSRLDLRVQEGINALGIPLFDRKHARKVLTGYGRALQALPSYGQSLDNSQKKFIEASVDQMADNEQVVPIHIAMFAQMLDPESWQLAELKRKGGWQGIGTRFLNKIFADKRLANSESICRELLAKLLPDSNSKIKGAEKSISQLMPVDASEKSKSQLLRVLDLLDREFRIITPTETDETERYYQLAHDSLVVPIRTWLAQQQAQTWQGRSRARVTPLVSRWNEKPENRFLPSLLEFIPIKFGVKSSELTDGEKKYLGAATRYYSVRGLILFSLIAAVIFNGTQMLQKSRMARAREHYQNLLTASPAEVDVRLEIMKQHSASIRNDLIGDTSRLDLRNQEDLNRLFAKAHFARTQDDFPLDQLARAIHVVDSEDSANIIRLLSEHKLGADFNAKIVSRLNQDFRNSATDLDRVRTAIVGFHVSGPEMLRGIVRMRENPETRESFIDLYSQRHGNLSDAIDVVENSRDFDLVSAFLKSLGALPRSKFGDDELRRFVLAASKQFTSSDSTAVHSAAEWALRSMKVELPSLDDSNAKTWFVDRLVSTREITFVHIAPHQVDGVGLDLDVGFYASSKEVSVGLFSEYLESIPRNRIVDLGWVPFCLIDQLEFGSATRDYFERSPLMNFRDRDLPALDVSWEEAAGFCNWLSEREGRRPRYSIDEEKKWVCSKEGDGYRLPNVFEFDALNRAGSSTKYFFGDTPQFLNKYSWAWFVDLPFEKVNVGFRGARMPNNFGIFDSTGNAAEWCDYFGEGSSGLPYLRGGCVAWDSAYLESSKVEEHTRTTRGEAGIRLVLDE